MSVSYNPRSVHLFNLINIKYVTTQTHFLTKSVMKMYISNDALMMFHNIAQCKIFLTFLDDKNSVIYINSGNTKNLRN